MLTRYEDRWLDISIYPQTPPNFVWGSKKTKQSFVSLVILNTQKPDEKLLNFKLLECIFGFDPFYLEIFGQIIDSSNIKIPLQSNKKLFIS